MIETLALGLFLAALPLEQFSALGVTILKLTGGLAFLAWLFSRLRSTDPIRWDPGLTLMVLFSGWGVASGFWSTDPAVTMSAFPTYALLLVSYLLIVNMVRNEKQFSAVMIALWLGTLVLVLSGTTDMAGALRLVETRRVSGILGNPNGYAAMLVACIPSGYWFFTRTRVPFRTVLTVAAIAAAAATTLYSLSRGGALAVVAFLLVLVAFRQTRRRGMVFAVLLLVFALRFAPSAFWERWEETRTRGDVRTSWLWPEALKAVARHPWLGSGLGTGGVGESNIHNAPLAVAVELGLPGLGLYLGFIGYATARLLRALRTRTKQGRTKDCAFAVVLLASFLGYMTTWFKGGGAEYGKMLWVMLGLMSAYAGILEQPPSIEDAEPSAALR